MDNILYEILGGALRVAQQAEVYCITSHETSASFEANRLKSLQSTDSSGAALRIINRGNFGLSSTTNISDVAGLINNAVEVSSFGVKAAFEFPSQQEYPNVDIYDTTAESYPIDDMVNLGQSVIDRVVSSIPDVVCEGTISKSVTTTTIMNSNGLNVSYIKSGFEISMQGTLIQGTDMLFVYDEFSSCKAIKETDGIANNIVEQLHLATTVAPSISGVLPVIFTPSAVANLLISPLVSAFNGKSILDGTSPLGGQLGRQIVDRKFSLWDDPTTPFSTDSGKMDDEGTPSRRNCLINEGVATSFLYDLQTASLAQTKSTGNAGRSLHSLPSPMPRVLLVNHGGTPTNAMVKDIRDGVIVSDVLGADQGNILAGDFSANILLGYRVTNGEVVGRLKDTVVSGNVYQLLHNIVEIGDTSHWSQGSISTPSLYCTGVSISSTA